MSWESPFVDAGRSGVEATDGERRLLRITARHRNLLIAAGASLVVALIAARTLVGGAGARAMVPPPIPTSSVAPIESAMNTEAAGVPDTPSLAEAPGAPVETIQGSQQGAIRGSLQGYAISLAELTGLSPVAAPGTTFDLWTMWEPPVTRRPKAQLLIRDVVLEGIVEPVTRDGPRVAMILVPEQQIDELVYGDRYGNLSAASNITP